MGRQLRSRRLLYPAAGMALLAILAGPLVISIYSHEDEEGPPAPGSGWEPETCLDLDKCGQTQPLVPMTYNAVGAGIVWTNNDWENPKIQYKGRHSEFRATDVVDEKCVERLILNAGFSAWPIPRAEWAQLWPDGSIDTTAPINIFKDGDPVTWHPVNNPMGNPSPGNSFNPCLRSSFKHLAYGGYRLRQGQSNFVANRIRAYYNREGSQLWDLGHPDAFKNRGIFSNVLLDEEDALMNLASFKDAGGSRGLNYSIYSLGYATLPDGRVANIGGHNMNSNSGFRKVNIYDPNQNRWAPRPEPCNIKNWRKDPGGVALGYKAYADAAAGGEGQGDRLINPPIGAPTWPGCDQRNREHVDPPHKSDMRYQRWYPSAITLPDGRVLVYGGDDLDESVGPNEADPNKDTRDTAFRASQIMVPVPEIYDPKTDTTIALENARKVFPLYPQATVVETGPGKNDWVVCMLGGERAPAAEATLPRTDAVNEAAEWRRFCDTPGCEQDTRSIRLRGARPAASLDCLNVLAAEKDPARNIPAENHWTHVDTAKDAHDYCCGMSDIVKIGPNGKTLAHTWTVFGGKVPRGQPEEGDRTATVEGLDFTDPAPTFEEKASLRIPCFGCYATALPDGKVLVNAGAGPGGQSYEDRHNTKYQLFDPDANTIQTLAKSSFITSNFHCSVVLLPTAETLTMGCDRSSLVQVGDRVFSPGDADLGMSVAQRFKPPYFFDHGADHENPELAPRPSIEFAPRHLRYRQKFIVIAKDEGEIDTVSMVRTGFVTHTLNTDIRLVMLHFQQFSIGDFRILVIDTPHRGSQAIPGDYMLFVVNEEGTPGVAKRVRLELD
jgi:hypothetical protein